MSRDDLVQKAKEFAIQVHEGHKRASGENYYEHTFRVYDKLRDAGIEEEVTLIAGILHQALDFSNALEPEIEKRFGPDVLKIVKIYRKLSETNIEGTTPKNFNEKYIIQTYINMAEDVRALVIRLADKIDNLETSFALPKEKRIDNAQKALYFYSPLARLMGMSRLAIQLENNAFKILQPGEYAHLEKFMKKRGAKLTKALTETEQFIKSILEENGIRAKVYFRIKHLYGIYRKQAYLMSKGVTVGKNLENIYDIGAMRIIVDSEDQCYIVENLLKEYIECLPDERDDYIRIPRHTGYKSIHNIFKLTRDIFVEIQIRTKDMHEQAEFGPASHLLYKIGDKDRKSGAVEKFKSYLKDNPFWFKDMHFLSMENTLAGYRPNTPFSKYVYAFTPKGDIIELPKGSNLIDFAYAVHTTLGHSCIGGFANSQMVKLTYEIKDGDHIEIKTLKNKHKPSPDWIKIVKTTKARAHIRKALKLA
jgi:guanosine-3',5'-bis(diphosphate) 3'-pyrophosphohydrolase